ncbi:UNVERIFIED_ORG: hypothetical protein J2Y77_000897 [Pseudomonas lini]
MSVMKKVNTKQFRKVEISELSEREQMFVKIFRQLDEGSQKDILRFVDILLKIK